MRKVHYYDIIYELTRKELAVRYKHLVFGYLWSVLSPLLFTFVYYIVFKMIMKVPQENYVLFLIAGLFPWQWITNSVGQAPGTFISNSSLIKKTSFPRYLISLVVVAQDCIHFLFTIPILLFFMLMYESYPSALWLPGILLMICIQFIFVYALNLLIATITLFFRDLERFVSILLMLAFYLTPVLYSENMVPEKLRHLLFANPFAMLMLNWRSVILESHINTSYVFASILWSLGFLVLAQWAYKKLSWRFAEIL